MKNIIYITFMLFCTFSCGNNTTKAKHNSNSNFTIKRLCITDTIHLEQIKSIISNTDCFEMHKEERNVIFLIYQSNNLIVSLTHYIGYDNEDLKQEYGGFYKKVGNQLFLFVVCKTNFIPNNIFCTTDNVINVKTYMGFPDMASDAEWYIINENDKLKLHSINCW
jgi:hypothetical protein